MSDTMKNRVARLTERQREVVRLVSLGCTMDEAGAILGLSPSTVDNHRARAMKVLGADKAAIVTRLAIKYKISSLADALSVAEKRKSGRKKDGWN
ncbi:MAG: helix-turn-helix transcriptional regulator [Pirellulales bacterium]|nr:helix-turn-helix transcriptional regulator [Pirellulales bacterium]